MNEEQQNSPDALCPRCGTKASWHFLDETEEMVEIVCPDCGRFDLPTANFEQAEFDIAPADEGRDYTGDGIMPARTCFGTRIALASLGTIWYEHESPF